MTINEETEDPGELGERIANIEMNLLEFADHQDPRIRAKARAGLRRIEAMKQVILDAIQEIADKQAEVGIQDGDNHD